MYRNTDFGIRLPVFWMLTLPLANFSRFWELFTQNSILLILTFLVDSLLFSLHAYLSLWWPYPCFPDKSWVVTAFVLSPIGLKVNMWSHIAYDIWVGFYQMTAEWAALLIKRDISLISLDMIWMNVRPGTMALMRWISWRKGVTDREVEQKVEKSALQMKIFYSSSVYSCHLFLISSASVRSIPFLFFIVPIFAWNVPLVSLIFLKRSLDFPIQLFSSISLHWSLREAFLPLLAILWNFAFKWVYLSFSP